MILGTCLPPQRWSCEFSQIGLPECPVRPGPRVPGWVWGGGGPIAIWAMPNCPNVERINSTVRELSENYNIFRFSVDYSQDIIIKIYFAQGKMYHHHHHPSKCHRPLNKAGRSKTWNENCINCFSGFLLYDVLIKEKISSSNFSRV